MAYQNISPKIASEMLNSNEAILIDVRELAEHKNLHIPNSALHPLGKINKNDIVNHGKAVIIYCQKGLRGQKACQKLTEQNTSIPLFNIEGGIEAWEQANFPTVRLKTKGLSLDRQVQLIIGLLLIGLSISTLFFSINFAWAITLIGLGLIIAATTGFCGLGRLIAMMPWNKE